MWRSNDRNRTGHRASESVAKNFLLAADPTMAVVAAVTSVLTMAGKEYSRKREPDRDERDEADRVHAMRRHHLKKLDHPALTPVANVTLTDFPAEVLVRILTDVAEYTKNRSINCLRFRLASIARVCRLFRSLASDIARRRDVLVPCDICLEREQDCEIWSLKQQCVSCITRWSKIRHIVVPKNKPKYVASKLPYHLSKQVGHIYSPVFGC